MSFSFSSENVASCTVLPIKYLSKGTAVEKSSHTLKMYSKSTMSAIGKAKISLVNPKKMESYLIDSTILAILLRYTVWKLLSRWSCWLCKLRTFCPLEKIHRPVTEREADEDYDRSLKSRLDRCRERIHCTKNLIYIKFTWCKYGAKKWKLTKVKSRANSNTLFAHEFTAPCKLVCK